MLVCMDKKQKKRTILALTPKLTRDPNFSSVSFRPNYMSSFLDVSAFFLFRMSIEITDTEKDHIFSKIECWSDFNLMLKKALT